MPTIPPKTDRTAGVPIFTTMDTAVSIFRQDIIHPLVNAVSGILTGPQGISRLLFSAAIRCQEGRGSSRTPAMSRTMFGLRPTTWQFRAEFWKSVNMISEPAD